MRAVKASLRQFHTPPRIRGALPALLAAGALLSTNCKQSPARDHLAAAEMCRGVIRKPTGQQLVTAKDGRVLDERLPCFGRSTCLDGGEDTVAVPVSRGVFRVRAGALERTHTVNGALPMRSGTKVPGLALHPEAAMLSSAEGIEILDAVKSTSERFPLPELAPGEQVAGLAVLEDGYGLHVTTLADPCAPPRLHWLRRPAVLDVVPAGAEPFSRERRLRGWVEADGGGWTFVRLPGRARLRIPLSSERSPTLLVAPGILLAHADERAVVFDEQGHARAFELGDHQRLLELNEHVLLLDEDEGLFRVTLAGVEPLGSTTPGTDLAGEPVPPGSRRERVHAAASDAGQVLLIERIRLPSCRAEDRVHLFDLAKGTRRTLATGDRVRIHPTFADGAFRWVEGAPVYEFVGG